MDMPWKISEACKQDVDEQVGAAAGDEEDTNGWDWCVMLVRRNGEGEGEDELKIVIRTRRRVLIILECAEWFARSYSGCEVLSCFERCSEMVIPKGLERFFKKLVL
jgi:hypothetical protein